MELVGKAVRYILRSDPGVTQFTGDRVYAALMPQDVKIPAVRHLVAALIPHDTKSGPSCLDEFIVNVDCYSDDAFECAKLASSIRTALDRYQHQSVQGIDLNGIQLLNAYEDPEREDALDIYTWRLEFKIRVNN